MTCGSIAASVIVVFPFRKAFAMIRFSVAVTANPPTSVISPSANAPENSIILSSPVYVYPIAVSPSMWSSIDRFPRLHHPGKGMLTFQKRFRSTGRSRIPARIFLIFSISKCSSEMAVVSIVRIFHSNVVLTQSDSMIEMKEKTSPMRGTFSMRERIKRRHPAISGRLAFFDPEICTVPERNCGPSMWSIEEKKMDEL